MLHINREFNQNIEIFILLALRNHKQQFDQDLLDSIEQLGMDLSLLDDSYMNLYDTYAQIFKDYSIVNDNYAFYFDDSNNTFFFSLMNVVSKFQVNQTNEDYHYLRNELLKSFLHSKDIQVDTRELEDMTFVMSVLSQLQIQESVKWKLLSIYNQPQQYFSNLQELIVNNKGAYVKAYQTIQDGIVSLIDQYDKILSNNEDLRIAKFIDSNQDDMYSYPSLALPCSICIEDNTLVYGLLTPLIANNTESIESIKSDLLVKVKALSDKSKLDILYLLKNKPMYSLEISQTLNLSPSTISHHIQHLLNAGLVSIFKDKGKAYFSINEEAFNQLINHITQSFL